MTPERFHTVTSKYASLRAAVVGDFCLDRYLEIDPDKQEVSIETGLPVHNVIQVRPQPGGAGTIINNLAALGLAAIYPIGFAGDDGEGFELCRALEQRPGVVMDGFVRTRQRRTFTYCKPLLMRRGKPPEELNRLDQKNWDPTPDLLQGQVVGWLYELATKVDAIIVLDQVDVPETGVVTAKMLSAIEALGRKCPGMIILADSRRSVKGFPPIMLKMNAAELSALKGATAPLAPGEISDAAATLAVENRRSVFVTLAEHGILGATPDGKAEHVAALPRRGEIDVVGAGDAVSANLTAAMASGANLRESLELANAAASVVIHKVGTTGTANVGELETLLVEASTSE